MSKNGKTISSFDDNSDFVIITFSDFADLLDDNGSPVYQTPTISKSWYYSISNVYTTYNRASTIYSACTYIYLYWPFIVKIMF